MYKLFLDETMTYSSGIHRPGAHCQPEDFTDAHRSFPSSSARALHIKCMLRRLAAVAGDSLKQAQLNKLDALIERAGIKKTDHVLEIGCGWGSMAIHAVQVQAPPS